jgi:hypothetical protein
MGSEQRGMRNEDEIFSGKAVEWVLRIVEVHAILRAKVRRY